MTRRKAVPSVQSLARVACCPEQTEQLLAAGLDSAFVIARGSVEALMARVPGLCGEDARRLHQRASALAVLAARHWREQRLTATQKTHQPWRSGLRTLVDGPTFENLFSPSWDDNCPPGSIEATTSPVAYLTALYQWATTVIEPLANTEEDDPIFLAERRPDLAALRLDNQSLERVEPTIGIVNEILERSARKHLDDHNLKDRSVDDALLEARYPFGLPFERYMSQINAILRRKAFSLGDLTRQLDPQFPYFCRGGLHSLRSDDALQLDTELGPEQRALLLESAYFPRGARRASARSVQTLTNPRSRLREPLPALQGNFFQRHYGVAKAEDLVPLSAFCLRTGLDQDGVESLLSIQRHAPVASPNVPGLAPASPARFGSVYINGGVEPALGMTHVTGGHQLSDWVNDHFDRIQRMTRLARWLELSFGETDQLLDAALLAEYGSTGRGREISENTLRALGLFCRLRRDFNVSAEDFAALLQGVALYALGSETPQFDRVFNDPTLFSEPLVLDDSPFSIIPTDEAGQRKVHHLCAALGIDFETYLYLARYIAQDWNQKAMLAGEQEERLYWSHAVVSAFYRLARLPAWLGLGSVGALALLQLIGNRGHQYIARLVRTTLAIHQHSDLADTLSVVQSLVDTVQWCREHELSVGWLYQHLMPLAPVAAASDHELDLLRQINGRMLPTILAESVFREAGLPMVSGVDISMPIDWLKQLQDFVSEQGLILETSDSPSAEDYEAALKESLEQIVDNLELDQGPHVVVQLFQLVMDARSAQRTLVWESLASTFGGSAELNQEVLVWAGGNSYQLLGEVLRLFDGQNEPQPIPIGDEVLALFARLGHRMGIVSQLSLSPLALRSWCQHPEWFDVQQRDEDGEVTFADLHLLTQYRYLLAFTHQAEQSILDYLKLVNDLPPDLTDQDLQLIREDAAGRVAVFTGFSVREILEAARDITEDGIIATLRQLDHLVRVRQVCTALQLGGDAALELSRLRADSPRQAYRSAAENALHSLLEQVAGQRQLTEGEQGQSEASWMVVDTQLLVARAGGKARCLLTVKNLLGQPMPGITVRWDTTLSSMGTASSITTDENGQVENHLLAGEEMGTAQVIARFGLDRQVLAPLILIDCDDTSLRFQDPVCAPLEALAGNLESIEYRLQVLDSHDNPGRDRVIEWSTDRGTFERPQTRTDSDGFAGASLRSLSSGTATVRARLPLNGEQEPFPLVTFLEQQYFQYVRFNGPVAATQVTTVTSRVVNLDGSPQGNVTVLWSADFGGFDTDPARTLSNADGIASIGYLSDEPGAVTLTVNARYDNKDLLPLSSQRTVVHQLPDLVEMEPAQQDYAMFQASPASFQVRLEPAAAGYPVTWWAGDELLATSYTSAKGLAGYQQHFKPDQLGEHTITVRSVREGDSFDFKVLVVEPHERLVAHAPFDSPGIVLVEPDRLIFAVDPGLSSSLEVFAERLNGAGDKDARLFFSLDNYADPAALGIVFDPPLGQPVYCDADGKATLRIDCTKAEFLPNSDPHNNHMRLHVTSNLGVKLSLWIGLRYLLDLPGSALRFFRDTLVLVDVAGLSGPLHRRNTDAPMRFREGQRLLRATLEGASDPVETVLLSDDQGAAWVYVEAILGGRGALGSKCTLAALGDLAKRVEFIGGNVFEATKIISGASLALEVTADPGLIEDDGTIIVDQGGTYRLTLTCSDAQGPIVGALVMPPRVLVGGVEYLSGGATDASGQVHLTVDAHNPVYGQPHGFQPGIGAASLAVQLRAYELVVTEVDLAVNDKGEVRASVEFSRREGRTFSGEGNWHGSIRADEGSISPFLLPAHPQRVSFTSAWLSTPMPGTVRTALAVPSSVYRYLIGETEVPIDEDLTKGDKS